MKHEHEKDGVKSVVHLMDCMEGMKQYPDNYFELAIVDPPYGINIAKSGKVGGGKLANVSVYKPSNWDEEPPDMYYFRELIRISKNQIIWGANHFIDKIPTPNSPCWIVWDKNNTGNFADFELAWTSFSTSAKKIQITWNGMLQHDMKNKEHRIHPTQKPVKLYEWLLMNYAKEGDKILDTHLGSGSSRIAAHNLGFDFTGYELDEDYFNDHVKRFETHIKQLKLF